MFSEKYQQYVLKKAKAEKKDQTYFLYTISKEKLNHIIFPLQDYCEKEETKKLAEEKNLVTVAQKKESQEICFIPEDDYQNFLRTYGKYQGKKGKIVLSDGTVLGEHEGLMHYTIGQRKGLRISYAKPLYVLALNQKKNEVVVGTEDELYQKELYVTDVNWMIFDQLQEPLHCRAKVRYRAKEAECMVYPEKEKIRVLFDVEQRAITLGQSIVFYDEDGIVLGGGKIG